MRLFSHLKRARALHLKLYPKPRPQPWMPVGVCVHLEENGEYSYASEEDAKIDERCKKLGIVPNVYIISEDGFNPNNDGIEGREEYE
jgi:hypothetical protein